MTATMRRGGCTFRFTLLWLWSTITVLLLFQPPQQRHFLVHAWYTCPEDRGGGTCPDGATCCATSTPGISSCITEKEDEYVGVCCTDDGTGVTGCDHNYACASLRSAATATTTAMTTTTRAGITTSNSMAATSITSTTHSLSSKDDDDDDDNSNNEIYGVDDDNALITNKIVDRNNKTDASNIDDTNDSPNQNETQSSNQQATTTPPQHYCQRIEHPDDRDIPPQLPRYQLCTAPRQELTDLYGLTVKPRAPRLAYYSSLNHLDATDPHSLARHAHVRLAWIFIHGSKRNADDYHCCALATLPKDEQNLETSSILVLSPRFLDRSDGPVTMVNPVNCSTSNNEGEETTNTSTSHDSSECSTEPLYYAKHGPIAHTWRYGADAVNAPISSYRAIDAMVEALAFDTVRFPNLERIIVSGHSAGGQYVHRWALTSMSPAWGDDASDNNNETNVGADSATAKVSTKQSGAKGDTAVQTPNETPKQRSVPIHVIAANPRSFAYLDQRRFDDVNTSNHQTVFEIPDERRIHNCPSYNQWEWGLEPGGRVVAHYKDHAMKKVGGADKMAARYAKRKVTYLAGALDVLPLWSECEDDDFQGPNRRTRSELFIKSLDEIFGEGHVHQRVVVPLVHHDHCLLFQSEQGRELLFGKEFETESQY